MEDLEKFAKIFVAEHNIGKYKINLEGAVAKGENYLGEVIFFSISPEEGSSFHFIRKKGKSLEDVSTQNSILLSSQREIYVYSVIFPALKEFLKKQKQEEALNIVPKIYHIEEEEAKKFIVLENLKYSGYKMLDKKLRMDDEKVSLLMKTYAKFHSISFAFKELEPVNFKNMTKNLNELWSSFKNVIDCEKYSKPLLKDAIKMVEEKNGAGLVSKFRPFEEDVENNVFVNVDEADKLVISHGDAWNNNLLFKIDEKGHPQSVCLIDFQMCNFSTPVLDLAYILLSVGDKDVLENIEKYIELYHKYLSQFLNSYGIDLQRVFSFDKLMDHWKKYSKAILMNTLIILHFSFAEGNEVPEDLSDLEFSDSSKMKNSKIYRERVYQVMLTFAKKFL